LFISFTFVLSAVIDRDTFRMRKGDGVTVDPDQEEAKPGSALMEALYDIRLSLRSIEVMLGLLIAQRRDEGATASTDRDIAARLPKFLTTRHVISIATLQRTFGIGFCKASRLIDRLTEEGRIIPGKNGVYRIVAAPKPPKIEW
jgi:DNA segregation ATPase FtsK/SpoIIIE-like protein